MKKNTELAQAFKNAIPFLAKSFSEAEDSGMQTEYICMAINLGNKNEALTIQARQVISDRLAGHRVFTSWLKYHIGEAEVVGDFFHNDQRKTQATRLAWLNSLVKEFS